MSTTKHRDLGSMARMWGTWTSALAVVALASGSADAEPQKKSSAKAARLAEEKAKAAERAEERAAKFRAIRAQRKRPERSRSLQRLRADEPQDVLHCVLEGTGEGGVFVSIALEADQTEGLKQLGHPVVTSRSDVEAGVIFESRLYKGFRLAPPRPADCTGCADDELYGPDPDTLARYVGRPVRLVLETNQAQYRLVTEIRAGEEPKKAQLPSRDSTSD